MLRRVRRATGSTGSSIGSSSARCLSAEPVLTTAGASAAADFFGGVRLGLRATPMQRPTSSSRACSPLMLRRACAGRRAFRRRARTRVLPLLRRPGRAPARARAHAALDRRLLLAFVAIGIVISRPDRQRAAAADNRRSPAAGPCLIRRDARRGETLAFAAAAVTSPAATTPATLAAFALLLTRIAAGALLAMLRLPLIARAGKLFGFLVRVIVVHGGGGGDLRVRRTLLLLLR